jgi:hypothetical protein
MEDLNFDNLKYNLYELLSVKQDSSESKINKSIRKLLLLFHPDKNNDVQELEIYHYVINAKEILLNQNKRKLYDDYLKNKNNTNDYTNLKSNFINHLNTLQISKEDAPKHFNLINEEFNKKNKYNEKPFEREEIFIEKCDIKDNNDFNNKFEEKLNTVIKNQEVVEFNFNNCTTLDKVFDNVYIENDVESSEFATLNTAFEVKKITQGSENSFHNIYKNHDYKTLQYSTILEMDN